MNFYRPLHYVCGEYVFMTDANSFSRFSTLMVQNGFNFWGTRYGDCGVSFCVSVISAERISRLASVAEIPLEIATRRGLPFVFSRYRKRYGMLLWLAVGLVLLFWSQLFAWKITVSGNVEIKTIEIERALEEFANVLFENVAGSVALVRQPFEHFLPGAFRDDDDGVVLDQA